MRITVEWSALAWQDSTRSAAEEPMRRNSTQN